MQSDGIQDSLTDVPLAGNQSLLKDGKDSDSFMQVLHDNSSVIVSRGPGGSVKIAKAPDSGGISKHLLRLLLCPGYLKFSNAVPSARKMSFSIQPCILLTLPHMLNEQRQDGAMKESAFPFADSQASTISGRSTGTKSATSSHSVELPDLPWSDWEIKASDIQMARHANGEPIKLGSGAYGTVSST